VCDKNIQATLSLAVILAEMLCQPFSSLFLLTADEGFTNHLPFCTYKLRGSRTGEMIIIIIMRTRKSGEIRAGPRPLCVLIAAGRTLQNIAIKIHLDAQISKNQQENCL